MDLESGIEQVGSHPALSEVLIEWPDQYDGSAHDLDIPLHRPRSISRVAPLRRLESRPTGYQGRVEFTEEPMRTTDTVYHVSRALYRRLAPLVPSGDPGAVARDRQRVLDGCEYTVRRLLDEPDFARPERFLFEEIRPYFPLTRQAWVRHTIDLHIRLARPLVEELRRAEGHQCSAYTRYGTRCRRRTRAGRDLCWSHQYLSTPSARATTERSV